VVVARREADALCRKTRPAAAAAAAGGGGGAARRPHVQPRPGALELGQQPRAPSWSSAPPPRDMRMSSRLGRALPAREDTRHNSRSSPPGHSSDAAPAARSSNSSPASPWRAAARRAQASGMLLRRKKGLVMTASYHPGSGPACCCSALCPCGPPPPPRDGGGGGRGFLAHSCRLACATPLNLKPLNPKP
jgi:hypothetical protein